ncbi:hypothetical protein ABW45_08165 [Stenotrophomonas maltophilia]|nr:hypothetical protein ABW45_08165 [Stenotrophomonas maltophilia]
MPIDALDIAYIAIGARQALADSSAGHSAISGFEGGLDYVQACIDQASLLHRVWQEVEGTFPGVWCYEVAEPFGYAFGKHLQLGGYLVDAELILRDILVGSMTSAVP